MTVISSRKPQVTAPTHTPQDVLDAITFAMPAMMTMTFGEAEEYLNGLLKGLEFMDMVESPMVQLHPVGTHFDIAFQMKGDPQFYYTALILRPKP